MFTTLTFYGIRVESWQPPLPMQEGTKAQSFLLDKTFHTPPEGLAWLYAHVKPWFRWISFQLHTPLLE